MFYTLIKHEFLANQRVRRIKTILKNNMQFKATEFKRKLSVVFQSVTLRYLCDISTVKLSYEATT